jgi:hypothetical protein
MASLPHNVEKAVFMPGAYRVYDQAGRVWIARKVHASKGEVWRATPGANNSARALTARVDARSLNELGRLVGGIKPVVARREELF